MTERVLVEGTDRIIDGRIDTALERAYRSLARHGETPTRRIALVERANAVRPRSVL